MINILLYLWQKHETLGEKHRPDLLCGRFHSKSNKNLGIIFLSERPFIFQDLMLNEERVPLVIKFLQRKPVRNVKNLSENCRLRAFTPILRTVSLNWHNFRHFWSILENFTPLDHKFTQL